MRNRTLSHWLALILVFAFSGAAFAADEGLDTGITDVIRNGRKAKAFHCKIPKTYGQTAPQALEKKTDEDLGEAAPPPPPDKNLCLTDPTMFYQDQAKWFYEQSVLTPVAPVTDSVVKVDGVANVSLRGVPEELRIFKRLLGDGLKDGKKPLLSGPASWPASADACPAHDALCALTKLYDLAGTCSGDAACEGREAAYLALNMGKTTKYFPSLTQWYPAKGPGGVDWTQRWETKTLRTMTHVFSMLPSSASRFPVDKDLRKFPPGTVIGDCPEGAAGKAVGCKPRESWPVADGGGRSTIGMAQIFFFDGSENTREARDRVDTRPAGYSDSYIMVTDKLVNADRMVTCKGLVHELTHHFDYSFMFDTADLNRRESNRTAAVDRLSREWGTRTFGKYSSLQITDPATGQASSFADLSWTCQRPGEGCQVKAGESAGFVTDYAHQVGPMDDFAESVGHYVCDPASLLLRSPAKFTWLKTHLFADRTTARGPGRDFWVPDHEKWQGFDDALKSVSGGTPGADALLTSCLGSFSQFSAQGFKWTSGPQAGQSFSKVAAFFPDPDPVRRREGNLKGFFAQDVLSQYNCVGETANKIDSTIRTGMTTGQKADPQYCGMGSQEAVTYLTSKRAGYVVTPFFQALANLGLKDKDGTLFQSLTTCKAETRDSCTFLKAFYEELDGFKDALASGGLSEQGKTKGVEKMLELLRGGS